MKPFNWNHYKNQKLIEVRKISFEDILFNIQKGRLLDDIEHPIDAPHQKLRFQWRFLTLSDWVCLDSKRALSPRPDSPPQAI